MAGMKKLVIIATMLAMSSVARSDVGLGLFIGDPLGLDLKIDLQRRSSLDMVFGWTRLHDAHAHYAHLTYLITPVVGRGESVLVPLRLGIGGAIYDDGRFADAVNLAVRVPGELALRFRRTPLEIYGELALEVTFLDENDVHDTVDLQGGVGLRFYF
jgi:hypothetical protein